MPAWLPAALRGEGHPLMAVAIGGLSALVPSILLSALAVMLLPDLARPEFKASGGVLLFAVVAFAPLVETLIMAAVLALLLRIAAPLPAILLSALGWGIAHSLQAASWGLVIWWPFLIFSTLFVAWRRRGLALALAVPAGAHALNNLLPALLMAAKASAGAP